MKSLRLLVTAGLAGALALGGTAAHAATAPKADPITSTVAQLLAASPVDRLFLGRSHQGNLFEVSSGGMATSKGSCPTVRLLGARLETEHKLLDSKLLPVASRERVELPDRPDTPEQRTLRLLSARSGVHFDRVWIPAQIAFHEKELALINQALQSGTREVQDLARAALPTATKHLELAKTAQRECTG
ncbi:DUF4142 domain-containing protein [Allokutzneria oryzae]|uniref:DUF4142 domain-containing protein n=1 Tax=Allokutzneria oryzae TaxID=1378989 RepID=A0ABV5ZT41_9PSEU